MIHFIVSYILFKFYVKFYLLICINDTQLYSLGFKFKPHDVDKKTLKPFDIRHYVVLMKATVASVSFPSRRRRSNTYVLIEQAIDTQIGLINGGDDISLWKHTNVYKEEFTSKNTWNQIELLRHVGLGITQFGSLTRLQSSCNVANGPPRPGPVYNIA